MKKIIILTMALTMIVGASLAQAPKRHTAMSKAAIEAKRHVTKKPARTSMLSAQKDGCTISSFPYQEHFEATTFGCWHVVDADGDGFCWDLSLLSGYGINGSGCAASASYDNDSDEALSPDNWLISPRIRIPASGLPLELAWYVAAQDDDYPAENYTVYVSTTDSATGSFTTMLFNETLQSDVWQRRSVSLAAYAGQDIFIAFRHHNCTDEFIMKIDDLSIMTAGMPQVTVNGPSGARTGDTLTFTATVSSTDTSAITTTWSIAGTTPTTNDTTAEAVWNAAGTYNVVASATNAIGTATDTLRVTILDCGATVTAPWNDGFEAGFLGCWTALDIDGDDETWYVADGSGRNGGYGLVSSSYDGQQVQDNWIISQPLTIPQSGSFDLSWYAMPYSSNWHEEHYGVYVSTTGDAVSDFTDSIFVETMPAIEDYTRRMVSLAAYAGQTIRIAFRHHCVDQYYLLIDDIAISAPSAPSVTIIAPEAATSIENVILRSDVSSSSPVTYSWRIEGATPSTATTDSVAVNWRGAADGTYAIYLTATNAVGSASDTAEIAIINCDGNINTFPFSTTFANGLGCWTTLDADQDGEEWFAAEGMGMASYGVDAMYMMFGYIVPINVNNYLVTPAIEVPATGHTSFKVTANSYYRDEGYFDSLEIRVSTTGADNAAAFNTVLVPQSRVTNEVHTADLSSFAGRTIHVAIVHKGYGAGILNVTQVDITNGAEGICNGETAGEPVSVYPNPATDKLTVTSQSRHNAELLDVNGRSVMTAGAESVTTFDISALPAGIYIVRTTTESGISINKIVKR